MKKGDLFPLADHYNGDMRFNSYSSSFLGYKAVASLRARYTGEKRNPKKGEWYLSGAIIEAYQARADMSTPYHIAEIVRIERVITDTIVEVLK